MPLSQRGKHRVLISYIVAIALAACIVIAGVIAFRERAPLRPGQPSPHALDQSQ